MSKKEKTNHEWSCQSIFFQFENGLFFIKTSNKDESSSPWKQVKWNKFPFYGDRLSGKTIHGD